MKINQVIEDFKITNDELKNYIKENGIFCDYFEENKICFVLCEGSSEMMYRPNQTPEEMYFSHFDLPEFMKPQKMKKLQKYLQFFLNKMYILQIIAYNNNIFSTYT